MLHSQGMFVPFETDVNITYKQTSGGFLSYSCFRRRLQLLQLQRCAALRCI